MRQENESYKKGGQVYKFLKYIYYRRTDAGRKWTIKKKELG
jgi:hypothetical protein